MDKQKIWKRLTDWEKSPVLNLVKEAFLRIKIQWYAEVVRENPFWKIYYNIGSVSFKLSQIGTPAVPALVKALEIGDEKVRVNAIRSLTYIPDKSIVPHIIDSLGDSHEHVRRQAIHALFIVATHSALVDIEFVSPYLLKMLKDSDEYVRLKASDSLAKISGYLTEEGNCESALKLVKQSTSSVMAVYSGRKGLYDISDRREMLNNFAEVTIRIKNKMNKSKKQSKARRDVLAS